MAKFIRLKESKAFLNLEYVSLVTEQEDGSVAVEIIDQDKTQVFSGNDAANILAALKAADRYNATMFLYHSFPRKPHQQNLEMGLKILDSILKRGLLITPEEKEAPAYNNLPSRLFLQQRVCFTALERDELSGHSKHFGEFSFEFEPTNLRAFGVLPAFYLTAPLPDGKFIHGAGGWVLRSLVESAEVFSNLYDRKHGDDKEFVNRVFPPGASDEPNATSIEELMFSIQAVLNLYYPTEDLSHPEIRELGYYKQREWKIIPNFAINNRWIYPRVKDFPDVQAELLKLNPVFFEKPLFTTNKPRVEQCLMFPSLHGVAIMSYAQRLLVPHEVAETAANMVKDVGFSFPVEAV